MWCKNLADQFQCWEKNLCGDSTDLPGQAQFQTRVLHARRDRTGALERQWDLAHQQGLQGSPEPVSPNCAPLRSWSSPCQWSCRASNWNSDVHRQSNAPSLCHSLAWSGPTRRIHSQPSLRGRLWTEPIGTLQPRTMSMTSMCGRCPHICTGLKREDRNRLSSKYLSRYERGSTPAYTSTSNAYLGHSFSLSLSLFVIPVERKAASPYNPNQPSSCFL